MEKKWPPLKECPQYIYGMINDYLGKFDWEDKEFGDDEKHYYYSSDEDNDTRYEYNPNVLKKFLQQLRGSRGYAVDCRPPAFFNSPFLLPLPSSLEDGKPVRDEMLNIALDVVLEDIRLKTGKSYLLEEVLKLVDSANRIFLITFTAKEPVPESPLETFLAAVFAPTGGGPEMYEVLECFLKPDVVAPESTRISLDSATVSGHQEPIIEKRRREDDDADISKNKTQKKIGTLDSFLQSLGLEKYLGRMS